MTVKLQIDLNPTEQKLSQIILLCSNWPWGTQAYIAAMKNLGKLFVTISAYRDDQLVGGCLATLKKQFGIRKLSIPSFGSIPDDETLWEQLILSCRNNRVYQLTLDTKCSDEIKDVPALPRERSRCYRNEYIWDLTGESIEQRLSSNHRRNVKKALKAGACVIECIDKAAIDKHVALMGLSASRRQSRGESVVISDATAFYESMIDHKAGSFWQVELGGQIVSSIFLIYGATHAYYHSGGSSPEAMKTGASHCLFVDVAKQLVDRSITTLHLGQAYLDAKGLNRFKAGFGANRRECVSLVSIPGRGAITLGIRVAECLRKSPTTPLKMLLSAHRFIVFCRDLSEPLPLPDEGSECVRKLTDQEVLGLASRHDGLADQAKRFERTGYNGAYGLFVGEELIHVSWIIPAQQDQQNSTRNIKLRDGEVEITHELTIPSRRGEGLYSKAVLHLCRICQDEGFKRVFMITNIHNIASQKGIEQAGLTRCGRILAIFSPLLPRLRVTLRPFRKSFERGKWINQAQEDSNCT